MKHLYAAFTALLITFSASAQLPDGSIAPDFTATDINGVEHNLYDLLDEGKKVILDFSATWCPPCWSYHESGALETVWEQYGPDGTDEVYVFYIESDDTTTPEDLEGTGSNTQGNWVEGTGYPIIDDAANIFDAYANTYYPTIYTVCPNRMRQESGQLAAADHASLLFANDCAAATMSNDAAVLNYTGETITCSGAATAVSVQLMNLGLDNLTSVTLECMVDGNSIMSYDWSGNLETYEIEDVQMGSYQFNGNTEMTIAVTSGDMNAENDMTTASVEGATESSTLFSINLTTDGWGAETGWEIRAIDGTLIASVDAGAYENATTYQEYASVPSTGCYTFTLTDTYGDGLFGSQWGNVDGNCQVYTMTDDLDIYSYVYAYDGTYNFSEDTRAADVMSVVGIEEQATASTFNVYPNPVVNTAWVDLSLTSSEDVRLDVINLIGQKVSSQDLGTMSAGNSRLPLDMSGLDSGIYLVTLTAGETVSTLRVTKQ